MGSDSYDRNVGRRKGMGKGEDKIAERVRMEDIVGAEEKQKREAKRRNDNGNKK